MKALKDHVILYDAECPMCKVYTSAFTRSGMLDTEGRAPYQEMPAFACPLVDRKRAVNEIALVNKVTGEVKYGIESLFAVIANSFPLFRPLFTCRPFAWLMRKVYAFISYNRKVIIPGSPAADPTLQPAFRLRYRLAYLLFTVAVVGFILTRYAKLLNGVLPTGSSYREYLIAGGQILFQGAVLIFYHPAKRWDYLGNMMTVSLAGALLLLPGVALASLTHLSPAIAALYFLCVAGGMLLEHIRRMRLLGLGSTPTITWIVYRLLVLGLILMAAA